MRQLFDLKKVISFDRYCEMNHEDCDNQAERRILDNVDQYGCHVALFEATYLPSFSYTIGLFSSYQHPEIIVFGLSL